MFDYSLLGLLVIVAGIVLMLVASLSSSGSKTKGERAKGAGVVLLGPIPIIFGNDSRLVVVAILLAIVLLVLALVAGFR